MSAHRHINSFNAGELSPLMDARGDSDKYRFSCRILENFIPRIYGGAFRRPGLEYLGEVGDSAAKVRLIPFNYSATTRFMLELGDEYIRFWSNGVQVTSGGSAVEETTPYTEDDIFDVQFVQLNDVCYFTHPSYPPQKLTRVADNDWTWEQMPLSWPALKDENILPVTVECDVTAAGATGTITFDDPDSLSREFVFESPNTNYTNTYVMIAHRRPEAFQELALSSSTTTGDGIRILGNYDVFTYGTWGGTLSLQRQRDSGEWETIKAWVGRQNRNITYSGTQLTEAFLRLTYDRFSHTGVPRAIMEAADSMATGLVKITGSATPSSNYEMAVEVVQDLFSTDPTEIWALDAWNGYDGYPRAIAFHEQRLMFGGNVTQPNSIWGSNIGDFENFRRYGYDDSGLAFTLAATEGSAIQGMVSHTTALNLFTQSEEWLVRSSSSDSAISPSNIVARRQSRFGSEYLQPFIVNESILMLQRGARKIREWVYSAIEERSQAADLTLLAEHVTKGGIVQMAFQQQPDPVIWCVTGNGVLLSMTFERDQNVVGWSRHPTTGTVESVAVIYGDVGESDEVWCVVKRTINSATVRYVERIDPEAWVKLDSPATYRDTLIYSDSAITLTASSPQKIWSGISHLEGETVAVLADGNVVEDLVVTGNAITLPNAASTVVVGLPYTSTLQPAKTYIDLPDGSSSGRKFNTRRVELNLWNSLGIEYADDDAATDWYPVISREVETTMDESQELFTGLSPQLNAGIHRDNIDFTVRQTKPLPANILSIVAKFDVYGD